MTHKALDIVVNRCIADVVKRFQRSPNVFLTEDDVRVHLCGKLLCHFDSEEQTRDGDRSISLHTEVRWYGEEQLHLRSDIVLVDVHDLDVLRFSKLPSKGYGFNCPKVIIEIKFRRPNGKSDNQWSAEILGDITKLESLRTVFSEAGFPGQTSFWVLALDKKRRISLTKEGSTSVNIIYGYASQSEHDASRH